MLRPQRPLFIFILVSGLRHLKIFRIKEPPIPGIWKFSRNWWVLWKNYKRTL
jgi:hypothetical protein